MACIKIISKNGVRDSKVLPRVTSAYDHFECNLRENERTYKDRSLLQEHVRYLCTKEYFTNIIKKKNSWEKDPPKEKEDEEKMYK